MCRNHSHLLAHFAGEDTLGPVPALMFHMLDDMLTIQGTSASGNKLTLRTSGMLYVPSWVMGGSLASPPRPMEGPRMSLFLLPDDGTTFTQYMEVAMKNYFAHYGIPLSDEESSLTRESGRVVDPLDLHTDAY